MRFDYFVLNAYPLKYEKIFWDNFSSLFLLSLSQAAFGCTMFKPLSKTDVAFADVIFEGRIQDVNSGEYVFDVTRVVKGNLSQAQVVVGLIDGVAYAPPKSKEEFISRYGDLSRIALTTPEQIKNFCGMKKIRSVTFREGAPVVTYIDALKCDSPLLRPNYSRAKEIPFIVRRPCGQPYIFSVENYSKMENYRKNHKKFEYLIENTLAGVTYDRRELYQVITGGTGPLPWDMKDK